MKITALSKRRHRLTAVFFGDVCETVDTETLLLSGLREGSEVSEEEWQSLKAAEQLLGAMKRRSIFSNTVLTPKASFSQSCARLFPPRSANTLFAVLSGSVFATTRHSQGILPTSFLTERDSESAAWPSSFKKGRRQGHYRRCFASMRTATRSGNCGRYKQKNTVRSPRTIKNSACLRRSCPHGIRLPRY